MKKTDWVRWYSRRLSLFRYEVVAKEWSSSYIRQHFNTAAYNILIVFEDPNTAQYNSANEFSFYQQVVLKKACQSLANFQKLDLDFYKIGKSYIDQTAKIQKQISSSLNNLQLLNLFRKFLKIDTKYWNSVVCVPFVLEQPFVQATLNILSSKLKDESKILKSLETIFTPQRKTFIVREQEDLMRVALGRSNLKEHFLKYRFIPCYDLSDEAWSFKHFQEQLSKLKKLDKTSLQLKLKEFQERSSKLKDKFEKILKDLDLNHEEKDLLQIGPLLAFWKDERDYFRRKASFQIQPLFLEIGKRAGLTLKEVVSLLSREIIDFLKNGKLVSKSEIDRRAQDYILLHSKRGIKLYSGAKARQIRKRELGELEIKKENKIFGMAAAHGKASGMAKIILSKDDLSKIQKGDIMVAVTTHPDFVPAMRICEAIVTDEGGVTSHAAIASRELQIPCVVGTQISTTVFNDGDRIEVDADLGRIRKLKLK